MGRVKGNLGKKLFKIWNFKMHIKCVKSIKDKLPN